MKKFLSAALAAVLVLSCCGAAFAEPSIEDIKFTGGEIKLSVAQVVEKLRTEGLAAQTAELNRKSDEAIASGYAESYDTLKTMADYINSLPYAAVSAAGLAGQVDGVKEIVARKTRDFAKGNLDSNHRADLNNLELTVYKLYYQTLQAQEYVEVSRESLRNKQKTRDTVQRRYQLGSASKLELTAAENSLVAAEKEFTDALSAYYAARMNFNLQAGYDLMAETTLSQEIEAVQAPQMSLDEAIASALSSRNEIASVKFGYEVQEIVWNHAVLTTNPRSSEYQKQNVAYLQMKQAADNIARQIELGIRSEYMSLAAKRQAIEAADSMVALASSALRIQQVSYDLGACTLADLEKAIADLSAAKLGRISAVCDYNLAVQQFIFDTGVGTSRVSL